MPLMSCHVISPYCDQPCAVAVCAQDSLKLPSAMRKRYRAPEETAAATEHANDDITGPRGSDATERAAITALIPAFDVIAAFDTIHAITALDTIAAFEAIMSTPAFDVATNAIAIGPCTLVCMQNEYELLCKMQQEINVRFRVPVSLEQLLQKYEQERELLYALKSWTGTIEAISRCIAAFQKATDAAELSDCQDIATKTCDYAIALAHKTPAYGGRGDLLALVHQFMENRAYNLAFKHLLNQAFLCAHERDGAFWSFADGSPMTCTSQREGCLRIIEMCTDAIRKHADHLQRKMDAYRASWKL